MTTISSTPQTPDRPPVEEVDVLVVGAGPTGLMMSLELQQRGLSVLCVDRSAEIDPRTRAVMVHARSLELLEQLDVATELVATGVRQQRISFHLHTGASYRIDFTGLPSAHPYYLNIDQPAFEAGLARQFTARGGRLQHGAQYLSHLDLADRVVSLVKIGPTVHQVRSRFVAGCDGATSAVRIGLFADEFPGRTFPFSYLLGEGRPASELPTDESSMYLSETGVVSVLPLPGGRLRVAGPFGGELQLGRDQQLSLAVYESALDQLGFGVRLRLEPVETLAFYAVHERVAPRFRVGNAFLLGDAAHLNAPAGGQAMNSGLADAHDLAGRIDEVVRGGLVGAQRESVLEGYHTERQSAAHAVIRSTDTRELLGRMRTATNPREIADLDAELDALALVWSQLPARQPEESAQ